MIEQLLPASVRARLKTALKRRLRRHGYSLVPTSPGGSSLPSWDIWNWVVRSGDFKTVIDIGANDGSYVAYLNKTFRPDRILAFEPLPSCQAKLRSLQSELPNLHVFDLALDEREGAQTFFENSYGPASSLLHVSDLSKRAFPETEGERALTVQLARLDDVLDAADLARDVFIKIDVQGVEDRVIRGGRAVFSAATLVLVEMSFAPMYDGQPLFEEVHDLLVGCGLRLGGFKNQIDDVETGRPLFAHCFYWRPNERGSDWRRPDDAEAGR